MPVFTFSGSSLVGYDQSNPAGISFVPDECGSPAAATNFSGGAYLTYAGSPVALPSGNSPMATIAWLQCSQLSVLNVATFSFGNGDSSGSRFSTVLSGYLLGLQFDGGGGVDFGCGGGIPRICDGMWHHIAIVYDPISAPGNNSLTIYVDGLSVHTCLLPSPLALPAIPNSNVYIGW